MTSVMIVKVEEKLGPTIFQALPETSMFQDAHSGAAVPMKPSFQVLQMPKFYHIDARILPQPVTTRPMHTSFFPDFKLKH
jgi:hypothetical protein